MHIVRPRYAEVDAQGVVFNAHWLTYFDESCTRFFESLGYEPSVAFFHEFDVMLVKAVVEWQGPAGFDDRVEITVEPTRLGNSSLDLGYTARVDGEVVCTATITYVSIKPGTHESVSIPAALRAKLDAAGANVRAAARARHGDAAGTGGSTVFERFTDRARRVVVLAQEEARLLNHNYIGTEHILLGLIHEGEGVAATALEALGVSLERTRAHVEEIIGHGGQAPSGHIPFTPRAKTVLEMSLREALQLGHNYIGTEHILLGLIREGEGVAAQALAAEGLELGRVRQTVVQLLSGYAGSGEVPESVSSAVSVQVRQSMPGPGPISGFGDHSSTAGAARSASGPKSGSRGWCAAARRGSATSVSPARPALVAEAGQEGPKQLRLRARFLPQAQTEAAEVAVERAFETVFGGGPRPSRSGSALIEDSGLLHPAVEQLMAVGQQAGEPDIWVDAVRFISQDEAEVHYRSPTLVGGGRMPMHGFAVLDDGVWKVSRVTLPADGLDGRGRGAASRIRGVRAARTTSARGRR